MSPNIPTTNSRASDERNRNALAWTKMPSRAFN